MSTELEPTEPQDDEAGELVPRKGHTLAQAKRALKRFNERAGMGDFFHMSDIGGFIKHKGTDKTGIGIILYAADVMKHGIENCQKLSEIETDGELRVRLQETIRGYADGMVKAGQTLIKAVEPETAGGTNNKPRLPPFEANTVIHGNVLVQPTEPRV